MRPPKNVRVGTWRYTLEETSDVQDDGDAGRHVAFTQKVLFAPGQGPDYLRDTVLHELLHAVLLMTGLSKRIGDNDREEELVRAITPGIIGLLRDNPKLVEFLTEVDRVRT